MDDETLLHTIRAACLSDPPMYDQRHLDEHGGAETAIQTGSIIESYPGRHRYLICGMVPDLQYDVRFHGRWLHVIVEYEEGATPSIATAYRPNKAEWIDHRRRR
jgi:hypothetical protein